MVRTWEVYFQCKQSQFLAKVICDSFMAWKKAAADVQDPYEEIVAILTDVEKDAGIRPGLLKKIYDKEAGVVYLRSRKRIHGDLAEIVFDAANTGAE